jgi:hypothetical protein
MSRKIVLLFGGFLAVAGAVVGFLTWSANRGRNSETFYCGANGDAWYCCAGFAGWLQLRFARHPSQEVLIAEAPEDERACLLAHARRGWGGARFLVLDRPFRQGTASARQVVYVCDRAYGTASAPTLFPAPPKHAAVFSDCTVGLLSTSEFAALDWSLYRDLADFFPTAENK